MERDEVKDLITAQTAGSLARIEAAVNLVAFKVTYMEEHMKTANGNTAKNVEKIESVRLQVEELEKNLPHSPINCPQNETLQELVEFKFNMEAEKSGVGKFKAKVAQAVTEKRAEFIKTATAVSVMIAAFALVVNLTFSVIGYFQRKELNVSQKDLKEEVDMINTPVRTRSGAIQFWPSGVLIDSLKAHQDTLKLDWLK